MGLDLWFREDVARILASAHETMRSLTDGVASANPEQAGAYQQGFQDALRAVGIAFGVAAPRPPDPAGSNRGPQIVEGGGYDWNGGWRR